MNEESKCILMETVDLFSNLQKNDQRNVVAFPISSLPSTKEKIKEVIKERIHYKNEEGQYFEGKRRFLENYYAYLGYFTLDSDVEFLNKIFSSLSENQKLLDLTDENFESEFHKIMSKDDFMKYQRGVVGRNAERISLKEEIENFEKNTLTQQ